MGAPRCKNAGSLCDSDVLLLGVGSSAMGGPEPNAPNTIDICKGEEGITVARSVFHQDESIDRIVVRSLDRRTITAGNEVEVEVTVYSAQDTTLRSIANKWSVAHVYYASNVPVETDDIAWHYIWSEAVEPGSADHIFRVRFYLDNDDNQTTTQAIRVYYEYSQYNARSCAGDGKSDDASYLDVDDLVFEVASASKQTEIPSDSDSASQPRPSFGYSAVDYASFLLLCGIWMWE